MNEFIAEFHGLIVWTAIILAAVVLTGFVLFVLSEKPTK